MPRFALPLFGWSYTWFIILEQIGNSLGQ
jgi:hypothetical protein